MSARVPAIAIVGMACRYPDARSPRELWQMVLAGRRAFRLMPEVRLRLADYAPRGEHDPDSIYPIEAALIEDYSFDRGRFRVPAATFAATDMTHWLALDIASEALEDAGFPDAAGLPCDETGVVIGNTLTGEFSRAALMRNRWPYVRRVVAGTLTGDGMDTARRDALLERLEETYKAPFAEPSEESLAGGLSNTIAGRICNHYGLRGGGFTVDGACAASLVAVATACALLASGQIDVALAGAVDLSIDPFELVGFARNGALAAEEMRVFDARGRVLARRGLRRGGADAPRRRAARTQTHLCDDSRLGLFHRRPRRPDAADGRGAGFGDAARLAHGRIWRRKCRVFRGARHRHRRRRSD
jgi:enediyne polyketide synthase